MAHRAEVASRLRLWRRGTAGLAAQGTSLVHRRFEVVVAIAKRNAALTHRHATVGFSVDAAIDRDELIGRTFDLDQPVDKNPARAIHRNEVGGPVTLTRHDKHSAGLKRDVRDQWI